jgi:hypothetical protein
MKTRSPLAVAAALAVAGLAAAQPVQVQFQKVRALPAEPTPTSTGKAADTAFKPAANADPDPKSLTVPADLQRKAKDLVGLLNSPRYIEREKATRQLATMGRMALPALQEAMGSANEPEVALRAEGLLPKAEAEDMKARVSCFLADAEGKFQHTLPGWEKFKAVAGDDKATRKLFAEMLKSGVTHQMLLAAEKAPDEANAVLNQYVSRLWNAQNGNNFRGGWGRGDDSGQPAQPAKLPDLVAAMFLEGQFTDKEVMVQVSVPWGWGNPGLQSVMNYYSGVNEVSNAIHSNSGEYAAPIRKILVQWMDTRETTQGANKAYELAGYVFGNDPKRRFKYALKVLEGESGPNTYYLKQNILSNMGSQTGLSVKEVVPAVAKCFDDTTMIWNWQSGNPGFDIQLRDFALAVALQLTDQKPEEYGMTRTANYGKAGEKNWQMQAFHFKDDNPPKNNPNGVIRRGGKAIDPVEEKKGEKKTEDKKPEDKEKKLSQEDRRKAAFAKWDEWVKAGGLTAEKKDEKADPKKPADGKKEEPKKEEPATTAPPVAPPIKK